MSLLLIFTTSPNSQVDSLAVEEGDGTKLLLTFAFPVIAEDYADGVTVEINAVAATVTGAVRQSNHRQVEFTIDTAVTNGDTVSFSYDASSGSYSKEDVVIDFALASIDNLVGTALNFALAANSGQILTLGL